MDTDAIINTYNYSYDSVWKDQLIDYNGNTITYDEIGNPLTYGSNITYSWINGRELSTYTDTSKNLEVEYTYNDEGIRTSKIINGVEHKYYLEGTNIVYETIGEDTLYYFYDATGSIEGFKYNEDLYYYIKNGQNDIIGIIDDEGTQVVSYTYDSWGQIISITDNLGNEITDPAHIGNINPFRYRSYYYDQETGLYYLNSRYYNPEMGRFLNIDSLLGANQDLASYNLYAYVGNNPINMSDPSGEFGIILGCLIIGAVAGFISGAVYGAAKSYKDTGKVKVSSVVKYGAIGAAGGAAIGVGVGALEYGATALLTPQVKDAAQQGYNNFNQLKQVLPKPENGNQIHHIVEQSQIVKSGFDPKLINNVNNVVEISKNLHQKISSYYSSKPIDLQTGGLTVRNWLAGQDFNTQRNFGIKVIEMFKR